MLEKVARAIHRADYNSDDASDFGWDADKELRMDQARAAIEAMREPDEAMDLAAVHAESFRSLGLLKTRRIWQAMIDEALKGDKGFGDE